MTKYKAREFRALLSRSSQYESDHPDDGHNENHREHNPADDIRSGRTAAGEVTLTVGATLYAECRRHHTSNNLQQRGFLIRIHGHRIQDCFSLRLASTTL